MCIERPAWLPDGDDVGLLLWVLVLGVGVEAAMMAALLVGAAVSSGARREAESCVGRAAGAVLARNVGVFGKGRKGCVRIGRLFCVWERVLLLPFPGRMHPEFPRLRQRSSLRNFR